MCRVKAETLKSKTIMGIFFNRVLVRTYWFYEKIVREDDDFMKFYYTSFAFSMFIVFYSWGLLLFLERKTKLDFSHIGITKYLIPAIIILGLCLTSLYIKRTKVEKLVKNTKLEFNIYDIVVIIYVFLSFFSFFFNLVQARQ